MGKRLLSGFNWVKVIGVLSLITGIFGLFDILIPGIEDLHMEVSTELFGIGLTVILIDSAYEFHNKKEKIEELILNAGSKVNEISIHSIEQLRRLNILSTDKMNGQTFWSANLVGAELHYSNLKNCNFGQTQLNNANFNQSNLTGSTFESANLSKASFHNAILKNTKLIMTKLDNTDFFEADFSGADCWSVDFRTCVNLTMDQLGEVSSLWHSIMPDGNVYDGRFNFKGDIEHAKSRNVNVDNPEEMALYYGVTIDQYNIGQE